ncbi:MAG: 2-oxo acid dehydrogenase subunit E2 [Deltaproteobacteria bacterium]|nr:2-oxo acid dehydrogenase subunit E2 [Deltaproteobacteria bacterium]
MPQPGETITEGTVVRWIKEVGDTVAEQEPVVELETAKAVYEYGSPIAGTLVKILVDAGGEQQVGEPLAVLECQESAAKKYFRLGVGIPLDAEGRTVAPAAPPMTKASRATTPESRTATTAGEERTFLPPFIRTLAAEHGIGEVMLRTIPGTGADGRLTKGDLLRYVAQQRPGEGTPAKGTARANLPPPLQGSQRVEPTPLRRRIAGNMILATQQIPHAGSAVDVDMTDLLALRERGKAGFAKRHGANLRLAPFFLFAVREGLHRYPVCNNFYFIGADGRHWIEEHPFINLGMAVGTDKGLIVPVLKGAEAKDFLTIAKESDALMQKAMAGKLTPDELSGATVTVNNPGALGSIHGHQILPYPQAVILGFQAICELPRYVAGHCVPRQIMELSISFDHRLVDGVEAVGLITTCKAILEHPGESFTEAA